MADYRGILEVSEAIVKIFRTCERPNIVNLKSTLRRAYNTKVWIEKYEST